MRLDAGVIAEPPERDLSVTTCSTRHVASTDGYAGTFHMQPLDAAALRALSEYLWHFTAYNYAGHAVLASEARGLGLTHALTIASLERAVAGACDRLTLRDWTHDATRRREF